MVNKKLFAVMLVLVLAMAAAGCGKDSKSGGGDKDGSTNSKASGKSVYSGPLLGKWYFSQEEADKAARAAAAGKLYSVDEYTSLAQSEKLPPGAEFDYHPYEFKSDGKLIVSGGMFVTEVSYTVNGNKIKATGDWVDYTISGTELKILQGGSGLTPGTYYKSKK